MDCLFIVYEEFIGIFFLVFRRRKSSGSVGGSYFVKGRLGGFLL